MELPERWVGERMGIPIHRPASIAQEEPHRGPAIRPSPPVTTLHQPHDLSPGLSARPILTVFHQSPRSRAGLVHPAVHAGRLPKDVGHPASQKTNQLCRESMSGLQGHEQVLKTYSILSCFHVSIPILPSSLAVVPCRRCVLWCVSCLMLYRSSTTTRSHM